MSNKKNIWKDINNFAFSTKEMFIKTAIYKKILYFRGYFTNKLKLNFGLS